MGESPREEASRQFAEMLGRLAGSRGIYGERAASTQFGLVNPYFERARSDISGGLSDATNYLNASLSTRLSGISQSLGESLINAGVPAGHGRGTAFATAVAPAIAATQQAQADIAKTGALSLADISKLQGLTMTDLLKASEAITSNLLRTQLGGIEGMKSSTTIGDILAGLATIASIIKGIPGIGYSVSGTGGTGGG